MNRYQSLLLQRFEGGLFVLNAPEFEHACAFKSDPWHHTPPPKFVPHEQASAVCFSGVAPSRFSSRPWLRLKAFPSSRVVQKSPYV